MEKNVILYTTNSWENYNKSQALSLSLSLSLTHTHACTNTHTFISHELFEKFSRQILSEITRSMQAPYRITQRSEMMNSNAFPHTTLFLSLSPLTLITVMHFYYTRKYCFWRYGKQEFEKTLDKARWCCYKVMG